jgi:hypothetical protein
MISGAVPICGLLNIFASFLLLAFRLPRAFEPVFPHAATGAFPIVGKVFKSGTFGDLSLPVSPVGIVDIPAGAGSLALLELVLVFAHSQDSPDCIYHGIKYITTFSFPGALSDPIPVSDEQGNLVRLVVDERLNLIRE